MPTHTDTRPRTLFSVANKGVSTAYAQPLRGTAAVVCYAAMMALSSLGFLGACHGGTTESSSPIKTTNSQLIANLHAFARMYGVVRWFHPSDAAAVVDWDRFAIEGVRRVTSVRDSRALRHVLTDIFAPVAPTAHIAATGEQFPDEPALHPASSASLEVVAWEHAGFGDDTAGSAYASKRRHRDRTVDAPDPPFASLWQAVDATPFRGNRVRLRGKIRTAKHALGRLWLRFDRGDTRGFFDNMAEHPVVGSRWETAEIIGTVESDATQILFGTVMSPPGTSWYDDLELSVQASDGTWKAIAIHDPGFESRDPLESWSTGTGPRRPMSLVGWKVTLDHEQPASGTTSLRIEAATKVLSDELFLDAPRAGETVDVDLGSDLRARIPLALYSKDGHTIGDDLEASRRTQRGPSVARAPGFDTNEGLADVVVVWGVLDHFWPYWDVVSVDWNAALDAALRGALADRSVDDHVATLERLSAAAPDGHATTTCRGASPRARPAFAVEVIEGKVVVTATEDGAVARGDVIISVDGQPALEQLAIHAARISGSFQWRQVRAADRFASGPEGGAVTLRLLREGAELTVTVVRRNSNLKVARPAIDRFDDGVYYVDLTRATAADIDATMEQLAAAPGVVFDVRGYPNSEKVLSNITTRPLVTSEGMSMPHVIRPDHVSMSVPSWGFDPDPEILSARQPHISGRVAFLAGPGTISYAETMIELVAHHHLGAIIGAPTAGTNGNRADIRTPSGCRTSFTALRVTQPDGGRFHLIGVQPTIPASRTIAGVLAGRDDVLERALAYVRGREQ